MTTKTLVRATVGPTELALGHAYVHDIELDGDEGLAVGKEVVVLDDAGRHFAATVVKHDGCLWNLQLIP